MKAIDALHDNLDLIKCPQDMSRQDSRLHPQFHEAKRPHEPDKTRQALILLPNPPVLPDALAVLSIPTPIPREAPEGKEAHTVWNEAYIMLVSCIDYALDMTCIQSVSQCFIVCGIL